MTQLESEKLKKLKAERMAMDVRIRDEENKLKKQQRKLDTRRKVMAGAWALEKAAKDTGFSVMMMAELKSFLTRNDERALFGLPPVQGGKPE